MARVLLGIAAILLGTQTVRADDSLTLDQAIQLALSRNERAQITDLGSSNGTFVKVNGERGCGHDSFVLLGQQLFRLNFL